MLIPSAIPVFLCFFAVIFMPCRGDADLLDFALYFNNRMQKAPALAEDYEGRIQRRFACI